MTKKEIIIKWYQELKYPSYMDEEFYSKLNNLSLDYFDIIENYDYNSHNGFEHLVAHLYFCERLKEEYKEKGYSYQILWDSLQDIVLWSEIYYELYNKVGIEEFPWCKRVFGLIIFRFGRLQLSMFPSEFDYTMLNIKKGDPIVEVHVPRGKSLSYEDCISSFKEGIKFLRTNYPNYKFDYILGHSWLFDDTLKKYLKPDSNILMFRNFFTVIDKEESIDTLRFTVSWGLNETNVDKFIPKTKLAERLLQAYLSGEKFYEGIAYVSVEELLKK